MKFKFILALALFSGFIHANEVMVVEHFQTLVPLTPKIIQIDESIIDIKVTENPNLSAMVVRLIMGSDSKQSMANFKQSWVLTIDEDEKMVVKFDGRGGTSLRKCFQSTSWGGTVSVKGVCALAAEIEIPKGFLFQGLSKNSFSLMRKTDLTNMKWQVRLISNIEVEQFINMLDDVSSNSEIEKTSISFARRMDLLNAKQIRLVDLIRIIKSKSFDDEKLIVIKVMKPFIINKNEAFIAISKMFSFDSDKEELQEILLR
jgi:hypothetical protein